MKKICFLLTAIALNAVVNAQNLPAVQFKYATKQLTQNVTAETQTSEVLVGQDFNGVYFMWAQFLNIVSVEKRSDLQSQGIRFLEYVPKNCYLLAIPSETNLTALYNAGLRAVSPMDETTKVDPRILDLQIPEYAIAGDHIALKLLLMEDVNTEGAARALKEMAVKQVQGTTDPRFLLATANLDQINEMADLPWMRYIEVIDPVGEPESVEGRTIQKGNLLDNALTVGGMSYRGDGIKILVRDDGDVGPHIDFHGRLWNDPTNGSSGTHGDGVAGVWGACGNLDPTIVASAPEAEVFVVDYLSTFLDNTLLLHQDSGVLITNSSYSNGCNAGYTSTTRYVDQMIVDNPTLLHVFSAGNSNNSDCGYGAGTQWGNITGGHKQGKNTLTVANLYRDGSLVSSSSRGPAHDGRIKPDIAGHGQGQRSTNPNNGYQSFGGTSAAAPSTAGNITQLYDVYMDMNGGANPPSGLIKAVALNTAQDLGNTGPDFKYGWGLVHAYRGYEVIANNQFLTSTISNGGSNSHDIVVPSGVGELRIMLYWMDPEASVSASPALVNNLDLVVEDPSSTNHLPYLLDHTPNPVLLDLPAGNGVDNLNNMEQVAFVSPTAGTYTVNVSGTSIPEGPQDYFVVYAFIPTGVKVTYPLGGEKLIPGVTERVHWDAFGETGTFNVQYSINNGGSWSNIATGLSASTRSVDWIVPNSTSGNCLVRVTRGAETDQSDETFSIHNIPSNINVSIVDSDEVDVSWNGVTGATSYNVYQLGDEKMELVGTTANTSMNIGNIEPGTHWFSVSANTNAAHGQRAFAVEHDHNIFSVCNGCTFELPLPYSEDFEESFGSMCNLTSDDIDWTLNSGSTPSTGTGPTGAQSGSSYAYIEASSPNFPNINAQLGGACLDFSSCTNAYIQFYYHMFGADMGTLELQVSQNQGNTWSPSIWSVSGDQGDVWHLVQVDLSAYCGGDFTFRFSGTTGTDFTSDICIDNLLIDDGIFCGVPASPIFSNVTDSSADLMWTSGSGAVTYDIELVNLSQGGGQTQIPTFTGIASNSYTISNLSSLTNYAVYLRSDCTGNNSPWIGPYIFGTVGCIEAIPWVENFDSYENCSTSGGSITCDFSSIWTQDNTDGNDWRLNSGGTPSSGTGPNVDNTTGTGAGKYVYIEASTVFSLTSNLISPCVDLSIIDSAELRFYYHMFGGDMGTLNVDVSTNGGGSWTNVWTQTGAVQANQSDPWEQVVVDLSGYNSVIQIRFQGVAGPNFESDMAIDDISIQKSNCAATHNITGIPASGNYSASGLISSDALIQNPNVVIFSGGGGVDLNQNFEVELGADFEANNNGCL